MLNSNISSTCAHNMAFLLASLGHRSKFQRVSRLGFVTAAKSFTGGQPHFCTMFGPLLGWYINIDFRQLLSLAEFRHVQKSLCVQVLRSPILAALLQGTPAVVSAKLCGVVQGMELRNFRRRRHLYSAGRPSRWASAHILVLNLIKS